LSVSPSRADNKPKADLTGCNRSNWNWVQVLPNEGKWTVIKGVAKGVTYSGGQFKAILYDNGQVIAKEPKTYNEIALSGADYLLLGKVHGKNIEAVQQRIGTDDDKLTYTGTISVTKSPDRSSIVEKITLIAESGYIGLVRQYPTEAGCSR